MFADLEQNDLTRNMNRLYHLNRKKKLNTTHGRNDDVLQLIAKTQESDCGILFIAEAPELAIVLGYQWQLDVCCSCGCISKRIEAFQVCYGIFSKELSSLLVCAHNSKVYIHKYVLRTII